VLIDQPMALTAKDGVKVTVGTADGEPESYVDFAEGSTPSE
jgi:hypothetical protein